jgi:hypothetical protein
VAAAAGESSALVACKGPATCPLAVTPAVLQSMIARPSVAVQTSLLMDTVTWQRGVLATPPVSSRCCLTCPAGPAATPCNKHVCPAAVVQ